MDTKRSVRHGSAHGSRKGSPQAEPGDLVLFAGGVAVGRVKALGDRCFLVVAEDEAAWVSDDAVFTRENGRLTLICEPAGLHRYVIGRTRAEPA